MTHQEREELIERIVKEVLARLRPSSAPTGARTPRVVVTVSATASLSVTDVLRDAARRGYAATVAPSRFAPERHLAAFQPFADTSGETQGLPADTVAVLAPELSVSDAAKLSLGILDDAPANALWRGLASGLPVFASPGFGFADGLPSPLARIASERRLACERLGVRWTESASLATLLSASVPASETPETIHIPTTQRRLLITEAMVMNLAEGTQELALPAQAILTPLAKDALRRRNIRARRR